MCTSSWIQVQDNIEAASEFKPMRIVVFFFFFLFDHSCKNNQETWIEKLKNVSIGGLKMLVQTKMSQLSEV